MARSVLFLLCIISFNISAQDVLRGEVRVIIEPVYISDYAEDNRRLDRESLYHRALEETAFFYSAMIYGWAFDYEVGERARGIAEDFSLTPVGEIPFGDPRLSVTDSKFEDIRLYVWSDYRLSTDQQRRMKIWTSGTVRSAQATGRGALSGADGESGWLDVKKAVLEDAARAAVRTMLRGSERNRPKEVKGFISLSSFPLYHIESGEWVVSARFRVEIKEIIPFSVY